MRRQSSRGGSSFCPSLRPGHHAACPCLLISLCASFVSVSTVFFSGYGRVNLLFRGKIAKTLRLTLAGITRMRCSEIKFCKFAEECPSNRKEVFATEPRRPPALLIGGLGAAILVGVLEFASPVQHFWWHGTAACDALSLRIA
jgi:hypothetical protein